MRVILLVGLPASGKSTYLERLGVTPLSSDLIRLLLTGDINDQSANRQVFATLRHLLRRRLELGRELTYLDATNLTRRERRAYIKLAGMYGATAEALFFDVPLEVCLERNRTRARQVPEEVLCRFALRLVPPTLEEGFSSITVIRD